VAWCALQVLTGGKRPGQGSGLEAGNFYEPTVITNAGIDM
jgi:hypothetical protein